MTQSGCNGNRFRLARVALALVLTAGIAWFLAGHLNLRFRSWQVGAIAPYTVYAPLHFSIPSEAGQTELQRGQLLVTKGERLTDPQVACLRLLDQMAGRARTQGSWLGAVLLAALFMAIGSIYLMRHEPHLWRKTSHGMLIGLTIGLVLGLARLILESPWVPAGIPVAAVAMFLGILLGGRVGTVLALLTTFLIGFMASVDFPVMAGFCVASFIGGDLIVRVRRRLDFFRVGLLTGLVQAATIGAGYLLMQWPLQIALTVSTAGLLSGILSSLITFALLPISESLFGLITDVTLVELSDLNHPLLRELSVKAPGTYHHSLIVASLAEAAAQAIGANALLARVGCYFHDIGKMLHPEYFVENQPIKGSRHDRLSPSMSSLVILNHVKDGIKLAKRYRLNPAIIDFIPGHHGTGLIYYFYRRALEEIEDAQLLKEERFRYPGPKPSTRETAVVLLADSVEAATRASREKTPSRLNEVVRRIINNKFIDGQLDEGDLTLKDLNRIADAFLRVLYGVYHARVEYPKLPTDESEENASMTG